jgi:hypothetical protein
MSPETETNYTLISAQFGWRLTRRRAENGDFVVEWRCAECWRDHKKKTQDAPASSSQSKPASDRSKNAPAPPSRASAASSVGARSSRPPPRASSKPPPVSPTSPPPRKRS